jgi:hypothetical protein
MRTARKALDFRDSKTANASAAGFFHLNFGAPDLLADFRSN